MTRTVYYTATSLDGFIATSDHSLGWLLSRENDPSGPMGYNGFIAGVGAVDAARGDDRHPATASPGCSRSCRAD